MTFKCFQIPAHDRATSEEMIEWLADFVGWDGDENGIFIYTPTCMIEDEPDGELFHPGDWITGIEDKSYERGKRLVGLPANARQMYNCQVTLNGEDREMELWGWPLPNGQLVVLYDGRTPVLYDRAVDNDHGRGVWLPERKCK